MIEGAIYRQRDGACLLARVLRTDSAWDRMRGLLGRAPLRAGEGLLIAPCSSVHTLGMGYPLDLVFLDREGRVRKCVSGLVPRRMAASRGAAMTLELAGGSLRGLDLRVGEVLEWRSRPWEP